VIFLNLIYPGATRWRSMFRLDPSHERIARDVEAILTSHVASLPCHRLRALGPVRWQDVYEWLMDHQLFDLEGERRRWLVDVFGGKEFLPMAELEMRLRLLCQPQLPVGEVA
jgi:hypothetical protein